MKSIRWWFAALASSIGCSTSSSSSLWVVCWGTAGVVAMIEATATNDHDDGVVHAQVVVTHPLDSLTADEYQNIVQIVAKDGRVTPNVRYPLISLKPPAKNLVKDWKVGDPIPRRAVAYVKDYGTMDTYKMEIDLTTATIVALEMAQGQHMILSEEFSGPTEIVLQSTEMVAGLNARGIEPNQVYCLPFTAGRFFFQEEEESIQLQPPEGQRLMKVTCNMIPLNGTSTNWWAQPIEGLIALIDLNTKRVLNVTDLGLLVPVAKDSFGYSLPEVQKRIGSTDRGGMPTTVSTVETKKKDEDTTTTTTSAPSTPFAMKGSQITWDIWRFRHRVDKRPGLILSQIEVWDETTKTWRSVLYEAHLSEVFVPYMDVSEAWYFKTYMDSGEYGFGIFMTTLTPGMDCPITATFLSSTFHDDMGLPMELPSTICLFERPIGDPMWRHSEYEDNGTVDGRPAKELVVRYTSTVGNYDYLVDYIFMPDGTMKMGVGSTGIDAIKGVSVASMNEPNAAEETRFGTLIAPNIVGVHHAHYFNYRLDFDIDGDANSFQKAHLALTKTADLGVDIPRKSIWTVNYETIPTELSARTKINPASPSNFYFVNPNVKGGLGHTPGYQLIPGGSYAYSLLDITDPPVARNAYIDNQLYVTRYDPNEIYAGGEYAFQSDGTDTLHTWSAADRDIENEDIVAWYTVGFHHVPRMEDWPVMPLHWAYFQVRPFNFFPYNPAMSLPMTTTTPITTKEDENVVPNVVITPKVVVVATHHKYAIAIWLVVAAAAFVVALYKAIRAKPCLKKNQACEQQSLIPK